MSTAAGDDHQLQKLQAEFDALTAEVTPTDEKRLRVKERKRERKREGLNPAFHHHHLSPSLSLSSREVMTHPPKAAAPSRWASS
jgi:hypothetical protein